MALGSDRRRSLEGHRVIALRKLGLLVAAFAVLCTGGCGGTSVEGGGAGTAAKLQQKVSPSILARANANCRHFLQQARKLGEGAFEEGSGTILERATERVVKPSIPMLEGMARRQEALARAAREPAFTLYADLFDPIVVLAQERLRSGRAAIRSGREVERERVKEVEDLMTELGVEQRNAARRAGLADCDIDFRKALVSALTG